MKNILLASLVLFIAGCFGPPLEPIRIDEIDHIEYTIGAQKIKENDWSGEFFQICGHITNVGDTTITERFWYSVSYYTDSSFTQLLGIDSDYYFWDLEPGETNVWWSNFTPKDEITASDYPNFGVKDIIFYKEV